MRVPVGPDDQLTPIGGLSGGQLSPDDDALARLYAPILLLDEVEPFRPQLAGVTVARSLSRSTSFERDLVPPEGGFVIEYAVWWDWDINHLYELEHVWVSVQHPDRESPAIIVEGSAHGNYRALDVECRGTHPVVYCEPGKHAFSSSGKALSLHPRSLRLLCGEWAGCGGLIGRSVAPGSVPLRYEPANRRMARRWLQPRAFVPSFEFTVSVEMELLPLYSWESVAAWIPGRMRYLLERARVIPIPAPLQAFEAESPEDLLTARSVGEPYDMVLVAEPQALAAGEAAERIHWASSQIRTARRLGIRMLLQLGGAVSDPMAAQIRGLINTSGLVQVVVLMLPVGTPVARVEAGSDLAIGYVLDGTDLDIAALSSAVESGVEYVFAPGGQSEVSPVTRKACAELGLSWIVLSHDDPGTEKSETTAVVLHRRI